MIQPFVPDPATDLSLKRQMGQYIYRTQDIEIKDGTVELMALDKHGLPKRPTILRRDPNNDGRWICMVHPVVGFPNTPCGCEEAVRLALQDMENLHAADPTRYAPAPYPSQFIVPTDTKWFDFPLAELEKVVKPFTSDRTKYMIARKMSLCDFMQVTEIIERMVSEAIEQEVIKNLREGGHDIGGNGLRKQFGRNPYDLGRYVRATLIREYFGFTYHQTQGFLMFLNTVGYIGPDFPKADTLCKWDRSEIAPFALMAVNAYLIRALEPLSPGRISFDGSGIGSNYFCNYMDHMRQKRIEAQKKAEGKKFKAVPEAKDGRKRNFWHTHVLMDPDLFVMINMSVTEAYGSEKEQFKTLLAQGKKFWTIRDHHVLADGGLNDVAVRNAICEEDAVPFVKWAKNAENAINPQRADEATPKATEVIEQTFLLAKMRPDIWLEHYRKRWKSETLFSAIQRKYNPYATSRYMEGARTQIIAKYVCHTIEMLAFAWRFMRVDRQYFGRNLALGSDD